MTVETENQQTDESKIEESDSATSVESTSGVQAVRWLYARHLLGALLVGGLLWIGYKAADLAYHGWGVYQRVSALQESLVGEEPIGTERTNLQVSDIDLAGLDLAMLGNEIEAIASDVDVLDHKMTFFAPFLGRLSWIPTYGSTIAHGPELLSAGNSGLQLGVDLQSVMQPALGDSLTLESIELDRLLDVAADSSTELTALAEDANLLAEKMALVDANAIDPRIGTNLQKVAPLLPLLSPFLRLAPSARDALGMVEPRSYLLLVQNNHELRPTGGFLTAIGRLVLEQGKVKELDFSDSYRVSRSNGEHPPAPEPLRRYMGAHMLLIRDANWSPDLPTAAKVIKSLYAADTGIIVDGIITIDLRAAELIVNALAPLDIEGAEEPLTGETLLQQILEFWSKPLDTGDTLATVGLGRWWQQRKDFMPKLADAALTKTQSGEADYEKLALALLTALDERAIQIWVDDPKVLESLRELQWDGALNPPDDGDFLAVIDSNLGFNKVDYVLRRSIDYRVEWPESSQEPAQVTATLRYDHPVERDGHQCDITPRYGETYEDAAARCYFNFVRLYVPRNSELIEIIGVEADTQSEQRGEYGLQVFSGYFIMHPGETREVTFRYRLPTGITADNYKLLIRRQSGTGPLSLTGSIANTTFQSTLDSGAYLWSFDY